MSTETSEGNVAAIMGVGGNMGVVLELEPSDILLPDETNVRPWSSAHKNEAEIEKLGRLAQSIAEEGQIQPVVVVRNEEGSVPGYVMIAGRRRLAAIKMHNLSADVPLKVKAVVAGIKEGKKKEQSMYRQASHENLQRENPNPMDMAMSIAATRVKFKEGGKGAKGTAKLAEFFKVSPATITQYEKLLTLPSELQAKVGAGELSNDAAFALISKEVPVETRGAVLERAREMEREEQEPSIDLTEGLGADIDETVVQKKKKARKAKGGGIKAKHIKAAAREVAGAVVKRSRTEIIEFFNSQLGPTNGFPNGAIHQFCDGFMQWCEGKLSDKKVDGLWDALVEKADRGTAPTKAAELAEKLSTVEVKTNAAKLKKALGGGAGKKGTAGKAAPKPTNKKKGKAAKKK